MTEGACRTCGGATVGYLSHSGHDYERCGDCDAVQRVVTQLPDAATEQAHYGLHENRVDDPGYRRFLSRLAAPLLEVLPPGSEGLDYGCGPGPALAAMLEESGHKVSLFDALFRPDCTVLERRYDFITCSETAEHFHHPGEEFRRLQGLLRPGGLLSVMTAMRPDDARFAAWHYPRDPTHVVFYTPRTFKYLAERLGCSVSFPAPDVVFLRSV